MVDHETPGGDPWHVGDVVHVLVLRPAGTGGGLTERVFTGKILGIGVAGVTLTDVQELRESSGAPVLFPWSAVQMMW